MPVQVPAGAGAAGAAPALFVVPCIAALESGVPASEAPLPAGATLWLAAVLDEASMR